MSIEENIFGYKVQTKKPHKKIASTRVGQFFPYAFLACSRRALRRASNF